MLLFAAHTDPQTKRFCYQDETASELFELQFKAMREAERYCVWGGNYRGDNAEDTDM